MKISVFGGYGSIPCELRSYKQWLLWKYENGTKVPYQVNGRRARTNDPCTWSSFDEVCAVANSYEGIAWVFSESDPYCGVDLDDCVDEKIVEPWAEEIIQRFSGVAYIEMSPSGTGVKLITRAKKPKNTRCSSGSGVECYDNRRFWAMTGFELSDKIGDGQESIEWLCKTYLSQQVKAPNQPANHFSVDSHFDLTSRAELYVDNSPPGVIGDLRNNAFRLSGHLHSLRTSSGEKLSESDVQSLLARWNSRNSSPLRDDELAEAARNGAKNGVARNLKYPDTKFSCTRVVDDIDDICNEGDLFTIAYSSMMPHDLLNIGGVIGQIVEYTIKASMYPQPELALAGALALMSTITGRKLRDSRDTRTNLYIAGLAGSGDGKEAARKTNKQLLLACGQEKLIGPERVASSSGLVSYTNAKLSPLFQIDEIGRLLATVKKGGAGSPHLFNIATVLMQLYTSSNSVWAGDAYADIEKNPVIKQPHLVVYGTSVPDSFWGGLDKDNLSDGLVGRFLIFEGRKRPQRTIPSQPEIPESLVSSLRWWGDFGGDFQDTNPQQVTAIHTKDAMTMLEYYLDEVDHHCREGDFLWSRNGEKVAKLSLIFAASRCSETVDIDVEEQDVLLAVRLVEHLTISILAERADGVSSNHIEESSNKLLGIIRSLGKCTLNDLHKKTRWMRKSERKDILDDLCQAGMVEIVIENKSDRPTTWVVARS